MLAIPTSLPEVFIIEPRLFGDSRGFFFESFNEREFSRLMGRNVRFVQDNHSRSLRNVLRGLHYQIEQPQGKLVRVIAGEIFDVAVDIRRNSPHFGRWTSAVLSADNRRQLWLPEGFAHGFVVMSEYAEVLYKATDYYAPQHERSIRWDDPTIGIAWPITSVPILSAKDREAPFLATQEAFA